MNEKLCVVIVNCKFKNKAADLMHVQLFIIMLVLDIVGQSSHLNQLLLSTVGYLK